MVVATVNAVNFVDGLDGLAAGVVGIGALAFFVFCYQLTSLNDARRGPPPARCSARRWPGPASASSSHNFHPARLFMGDSGSMLIGLVLSASAVTLSRPVLRPSELSEGAGGSQASLLPTLLPVLLPISILIVPLVDLVLAVVRRTRAGRSPFAPDKQHLHHRLLEIGHSQRRAVLIMWLWAGAGRVRHGAGEPLHRRRWCGSSLAAMTAADRRADLPAAGRPQAPARGSLRGVLTRRLRDPVSSASETLC